MAARWTTVDDLTAALMRRWEAGDLLVHPQRICPLTLPIRGPSPADIAARLPEVRSWIADLEAGGEDPGGGRRYRLSYREAVSRQLGSNRLPMAAVIETPDQALALIARTEERRRWASLLAATQAAVPALMPYLEQHPLLPLAHHEAWERALAVVAWFQSHAQDGHYARQIDVPGVDTKFIEREQALLSRLLSVALPAERIVAGPGSFARRFALRVKPVLVQLRILDPSLAVAGFTHFAAPLAELARWAPGASDVIITENEMNGLSLPPLPGTIAIFGRGYSVEVLSALPWVVRSRPWYWGDIDTHGLAILDRVRSHLPRARSLMMDEETLLSHREFWVEEPEPSRIEPERLDEGERRLFDDLRSHRFGHRLRLEQERIRFGWVSERLRQVFSSS